MLSLPSHVLRRLAYGPDTASRTWIARVGIDRWIAAQLDPPAGDNLTPAASTAISAMSTLSFETGDAFLRFGPPALHALRHDPKATKALFRQGNVIVQQARAARLLRAIYSPWQLREVLTEFWFNHFNVFFGKGLCRLWIGAYERDAIRPHVLGKFEDLLLATARHPAMLFYLDNWLSSAPGSPGARGRFSGFNENYGREVMELHTLGVDGGYRQADVDALSLILTGWSIRPARGFFFDRRRHDSSSKTLLGHRIRGGGEEEGVAALHFLARHPSTARHLSFQIAQLFVADRPPTRLVQVLADRWQETDGHIALVLATLFASPEFRDPRYRLSKLRTPYQYLLASVRAGGVTVSNPNPLNFFLRRMGQLTYNSIQPDGYKNTTAAWLDPDGVLLRLDFAVALGSGYLPISRHPGDSNEPRPLSADAVIAVIGHTDNDTVDALKRAPRRLQAAVVLGGPQSLCS